MGREAVVDPQPYTRSMLKLHEANTMPAVMPEPQTHPHLYDRLLAGGIQPDFPRPAPPKRTKPLLAAGLAAFVAVVLMLALLIALGVSRDPALSALELARLPGRPVTLVLMVKNADCAAKFVARCRKYVGPLTLGQLILRPTPMFETEDIFKTDEACAPGISPLFFPHRQMLCKAGSTTLLA